VIVHVVAREVFTVSVMLAAVLLAQMWPMRGDDE
jgi:hypothetical protein